LKNTQIQIKKLNSIEDAKVCAGMMADSEPWISLQRNFDESLSIITEPTREVYIGCIDEEIVGVIIIEMLGTFKGYIKSVCVSSQHRGKGIGSSLMNHAEDRIFSETPNVFLLVSNFNEGARKLYVRLGYSEVGEFKDYIVRGHSEILMRKTLGPLTEYRSE
jgi:ribosomal-protein-alanine N-acetyltransferase